MYDIYIYIWEFIMLSDSISVVPVLLETKISEVVKLIFMGETQMYISKQIYVPLPKVKKLLQETLLVSYPSH